MKVLECETQYTYIFEYADLQMKPIYARITADICKNTNSLCPIQVFAAKSRRKGKTSSVQEHEHGKESYPRMITKT